MNEVLVCILCFIIFPVAIFFIVLLTQYLLDNSEEIKNFFIRKNKKEEIEVKKENYEGNYAVIQGARVSLAAWNEVPDEIVLVVEALKAFQRSGYLKQVPRKYLNALDGYVGEFLKKEGKYIEIKKQIFDRMVEVLGNKERLYRIFPNCATVKAFQILENDDVRTSQFKMAFADATKGKDISEKMIFEKESNIITKSVNNPKKDIYLLDDFFTFMHERFQPRDDDPIQIKEITDSVCKGPQYSDWEIAREKIEKFTSRGFINPMTNPQLIDRVKTLVTILLEGIRDLDDKLKERLIKSKGWLEKKQKKYGKPIQ